MKFFGLLFAALLLISWASPVASKVYGSHDCISINKGKCFRWDKCLPFYDMLGKCDSLKICCKRKEEHVKSHSDGTTRKKEHFKSHSDGATRKHTVSVRIQHSSSHHMGGL
ncbi:Hypothetical predicted protein [Podarcis lilfordi]|uniref:Beta-defensin n=1 Tax=Podarcis lilfordi TaxID=74358 RepID=A0AA35K5E7_9SAUR|nr:Hypothetical predicted protein [Podarcis lilfordi]